MGGRNRPPRAGGDRIPPPPSPEVPLEEKAAPDLVTGATGFLGSHLVRALRRRGRPVRALVRPGTDTRLVEALGVEIVPGDVTDADGYAAAAHGAARIFHVAGFVSFFAEERPRMEAVNVGGVRNAVAAARSGKVPVLVVTSSVAAVGGGKTRDPVDEGQPWHGDESLGYAATKHAGEKAALAAAGEGLKVVCVNPSIVLGPHDPRPSVGGEYVILAARGRIPVAVDMIQGFVDVRDVAEGHLLAAERGRSGQRYILNAASIPMAEFVAMAREAAGRPGRPFALPPWVFLPAAWVAEWWGASTGRPVALTKERARMARRHAAYSAARARRDLGWEPRPLAETVRETVEWFGEERMLQAP